MEVDFVGDYTRYQQIDTCFYNVLVWRYSQFGQHLIPVILEPRVEEMWVVFNCFDHLISNVNIPRHTSLKECLYHPKHTIDATAYCAHNWALSPPGCRRKWFVNVFPTPCIVTLLATKNILSLLPYSLLTYGTPVPYQSNNEYSS